MIKISWVPIVVKKETLIVSVQFFYSKVFEAYSNNLLRWKLE